MLTIFYLSALAFLSCMVFICLVKPEKLHIKAKREVAAFTAACLLATLLSGLCLILEKLIC